MKTLRANLDEQVTRYLCKCPGAEMDKEGKDLIFPRRGLVDIDGLIETILEVIRTNAA